MMVQRLGDGQKICSVCWAREFTTPEPETGWIAGECDLCAARAERSKAAAILGGSRSPKKADASRENGKKGGRPVSGRTVNRLGKKQREEFVELFYARIDDALPDDLVLGEEADKDTDCPWGCPWLYDERIRVRGITVSEMVDDYISQIKDELATVLSEPTE